MEYEHIAAAIKDRILTLTLNRPDKLNAYTAQMGAELADAFDRANSDDDIRVIIVTGAGRGFCAGADISAGAGAFDTSSGKGSHLFGGGIDKTTRRAGGFVEAIFNCRKPSIAAINGPAVGVGATLTLPMDIRIAADTARFGFVFARRGLVPEAGSAWFLPQIVGFSQAMRWCLSGRVFDANEALSGGLISEAVAQDALLDRANEIAREIADETSAISIALTRQMLWRFAGAPDPFELLKIDGPLSVELGGTADVKEGVSAFLEKRKPRFPGRVSKDMPSRFPF
ncbi:MAG TPA: enoyl-CoA hydratase-related protein [Rhizomicrobium sp.]|nr:enoyl-CoA hydratase-related protein [Rhizomicrobium sp.]